MIYTIVPIEQITTDPELEVCEKNPSPEGKLRIPARYMDEEVLLNQSATGEYTIERLISTNPQNYLRKEFFPETAADVKNITLRHSYLP